MADGLSDGLQAILNRYRETPPGTPWSDDHPVKGIFSDVAEILRQAAPVTKRPTIKVDISGRGRQATLAWIGFLDRRTTQSAQSGVYCVYLFREDLSGVYLTFAIGVVEARKRFRSDTNGFENWIKSRVSELRGFAAELGAGGFSVDDAIDLRATGRKGRDYERATVAYRFYEIGAIPEDSVLLNELEAVLSVYDSYLEHEATDGSSEVPRPRATPSKAEMPFDLGTAVGDLIERIQRAGYVFEPWQIAAYIAAVQTKPFVILAGVTGTGKSTLPGLISDATGGKSVLIPVRPDWTDSSDVIGYTDLQAKFRPGAVLSIARQAMANGSVHLTCILDEMNLARVEQYLAEVLSRIEQRQPVVGGGYASGPLLEANDANETWGEVVLPRNIALVGTVNMDESSHGFSRKVLDRAFTLELSEIDLKRWEAEPAQEIVAAARWPISAWYPRANRLAALTDVTADDRRDVVRAIDALSEVNRYLTQAQLQVGYRTRDEVALFVLHCQALLGSFKISAGASVDPLDLALHMKVLPRIIGGTDAVRRAILQLLGWSVNGVPRESEDDVQVLMEEWHASGRASAFPGAIFPRTASRLCLMWDRVVAEGFTSFWL